MAHSDDDVPLVEAGGDLPEVSRRLVLVGGGFGETSHRYQTCQRQVGGCSVQRYGNSASKLVSGSEADVRSISFKFGS